MSVASPVAVVRYTIASLTEAFSTFAFNQPGDLLVTDGAYVLGLNSDYTVSGGGYNSANQLQAGTITLTNTGSFAGQINIGDTLIISRGLSPNLLFQTTSFASTGLQTPLMIEQDDDRLTCIAQQLALLFYNPFPPNIGAQFPISLGWITAQTGGVPGSIDSLNTTAIPTFQLPVFIQVSIQDDYEVWKLRPMQVGDPSVTTLPNFIVPISNSLNLIWVRVS
jgi:hypothetical protein